MDEASSAAEQPCPFCGQPIKTGAVVCRHCRRDLFNPNALPIVGFHDWEREAPPERVIYTVRIPVSDAQWRLMCYGLSLVIGTFWLMLLFRPSKTDQDGAAERKPIPIAIPTASPTAAPKTFADTGRPNPSRTHGALVSVNSEPDEPTLSPSPLPETTPDSNSTTASVSPDSGGRSPEDLAKLVVTGQTNAFQADELINFIDNEPDFAAQKVLHHLVQVSGVVVGTGRTADKHAYVMLKGTGDTNVQCEFDSLTPPNEASKGSTLQISGTPEGRYVDVIMTGCRLSR